ncbi:MAG: transporter substrate-binding domain-containing protein, partial [Campylobacteraceae bacterium]|nr:transporter substrate-binding domain-containing protein [Campylobacteraceae bacterium]
MFPKYLFSIFMLCILSTSSFAHLQKVTLQLSWYSQFQFAGYYIAKEKGFYRAVGLDVDIIPYEKDLNLLQKVINKEIDFSIANQSLLLNRNKNISVLYALFQSSPYSYLSLDKSKITNIKESDLFKSLKLNRINTYSDYLFTNKDLIASNEQLVDNFKKASLRGWKYAYSNIEETSILILNKYNEQNLNKELLIQEALILKKLSYLYFDPLGEINFKILENAIFLNEKKKVNNINSFIYKSNHTNLDFTKEEIKYLKTIKNINMCIISNAYPYSDLENGKFIGFVADYISMIEKKISIKFSLVKTNSIKELKNNIKLNKCDIIASLSKTVNREKIFNFTLPYLKVPFVLTTKNTVVYLDDLYSLKNVKISIKKGYSLLEKIKVIYPNIEFVEVKSIDDGFNKVLNSEIFGHLDSIALTWKLLQRTKYIRLKISGKLENTRDFSVAVLKSNKILFHIINKTIISIDPHITKNILNKWMTTQYEKYIDYKLISEILIIVLIIFIFIFYILISLINKNKKLQKEIVQKNIEQVSMNKDLREKVDKEVNKNIRKNKILAQQSKLASMGEMLANIAHQWRQPLNNINLLVHFLRDNYENKAFTKKDFSSYVHDIFLQISYMSKVIDDFGDFFKPNSQCELFDLKSVFNKTLRIMSSQFIKNDIEVIKDIDEIKLFTLENELVQVLINLINNAKYELLSSSIEKKLIFVSAKKDKDKIIIKISDNAGGINEDIINRVFEPYFTTKEENEGTGIGLYMSEEIIKKHMDGIIFVNNKEYVYEGINYIGATFTIILPINVNINVNIEVENKDNIVSYSTWRMEYRQQAASESKHKKGKKKQYSLFPTTSTLGEAVDEFIELLPRLKMHIFICYHQWNAHSTFRGNLDATTIITGEDYQRN